MEQLMTKFNNIVFLLSPNDDFMHTVSGNEQEVVVKKDWTDRWNSWWPSDKITVKIILMYVSN